MNDDRTLIHVAGFTILIFYLCSVEFSYKGYLLKFRNAFLKAPIFLEDV